MTSDTSADILIVGCGSIGSRHARNLRGLGVGRLVLVDPDGARRTALAAEVDGDPCQSLADGLRELPDAAVICAPTSMHLAIASEALRHGCDLLIEKPLSHSMIGVRDFVSASSTSGQVVMVGYNLRFNLVVRQLQTWLENDRIGRPVSARLHFGSDIVRRHPGEDYRTGYGARAELGGGVILDAIHELDAALCYFGLPNQIYCMAGTTGSLEIDVEDTAELLLEYEELYASIHLDFLEWPPRRTHEVTGTEGKIVADLIGGHATLYAERGEVVETFVDEDRDGEYVREAIHFLACIERSATPPVDAAGALTSLALAVAAKESSQLRRPVEFRAPDAITAP